MNPNLARPATTMTTPTKIDSREASATALAGSPLASSKRGGGGRDHRSESGVGAEHEHSRRTEDRVADQAQDRRVQPGDRREAGQLGVRHPLRHEERGQHQAGDEVLGQPLTTVVRDQRDAGYERVPLRRSGAGPIVPAHRGEPRDRPPREGSPATGEAAGPAEMTPSRRSPGRGEHDHVPARPGHWFSAPCSSGPSSPTGRDPSPPRSTSSWWGCCWPRAWRSCTWPRPAPHQADG